MVQGFVVCVGGPSVWSLPTSHFAGDPRRERTRDALRRVRAAPVAELACCRQPLLQTFEKQGTRIQNKPDAGSSSTPPLLQVRASCWRVQLASTVECSRTSPCGARCSWARG